MPMVMPLDSSATTSSSVIRLSGTRQRYGRSVGPATSGTLPTVENPPDRATALDFSGRAVIVTGGTRGLGRAIAGAFLDAGADVVTCARNAPKEVVASADGTRQAAFVPADVRDPDQVATLVATAVERMGRLDVLVNNAGGAPTADSATVSPRFNEKVVALNLIGPMTCCQAAYRVMADQDGTGVMINVSSVSGSRPNPLGVAYGAAKAGLANMAATLAHEWGPGVRVLTLAVGMIETDDAAAFYGDAKSRAAIGAHLAMGRLGHPAEVADMCLVLASPLARWVTGTTVEVHGGGEGPAWLATVADRDRD